MRSHMIRLVIILAIQSNVNECISKQIRVSGKATQEQMQAAIASVQSLWHPPDVLDLVAVSRQAARRLDAAVVALLF